MYCVSCKKDSPSENFCIYCGTRFSLNPAEERKKPPLKDPVSLRSAAKKETAFPHELDAAQDIQKTKKIGPDSADRQDTRRTRRSINQRKRRKAFRQKLIIAALVITFFASIGTAVLLTFQAYRQNVLRTLPTAEIAVVSTEDRETVPETETRYYAKIHSISQDGLAQVTLKIPYTYDEAFIASLSEGSRITVNGATFYFSEALAPGKHEGYETQQPLYYFERDPEHARWYHISQSGLNGEWALYSPSDMPVYRDEELRVLQIAPGVAAKDSLYTKQYGRDANDASLGDILARYGERDFYTHTFILTVRDNLITEIEMIFMP